MNRKLLLAILLGLLALSVAFAFRDSPRQERVAGSAARPALRGETPVREKAETAPEPPRLRLEVLEPPGEPFPGVTHNLFGGLFPAPPPVVRAPSPPPLPPTPMVVASPPPPAMPLQQELARFVFLGFLQKGEDKSIFLSSGEEIFIVRKGDRFGRNRQFAVQEVAPEKLVIRQGEDPRPIQISLVEQASLAPARAAPRHAPAPPARPTFPRPAVPDAQEGISGVREPSEGQPPEAQPPEVQPDPGRMALPEERRAAAARSRQSRPAPAEAGNGVLKPLPTSDFNNLFSNGPEKKPREESTVQNGQIEPAEGVSQ